MSARHCLLGAAVAAVVLSPLAGRQDAEAAGGLVLSPPIIERDAVPGRVGTVTITNNLASTADFVVTPRPWVQARSGAVSPNRSRQLNNVRVSATRFALAPRSRRTVAVDLTSVPRARSLYGNIEVVGRPRQAAPGQKLRFALRLVSVLRLNPPAPRRRFAVQAGRLGVRSGVLLLSARNAGNTASPITGTMQLTGPGGTRRTTLAAVRVVPGFNVELPLVRTRGLRRGTYTATIVLRQGGRAVGTVRRQVKLGA